jgi:hypothetical protein
MAGRLEVHEAIDEATGAPGNWQSLVLDHEEISVRAITYDHGGLGRSTGWSWIEHGQCADLPGALLDFQMCFSLLGATWGVTQPHFAENLPDVEHGVDFRGMRADVTIYREASMPEEARFYTDPTTSLPLGVEIIIGASQGEPMHFVTTFEHEMVERAAVEPGCLDRRSVENVVTGETPDLAELEIGMRVYSLGPVFDPEGPVPPLVLRQIRPGCYGPTALRYAPEGGDPHGAEAVVLHVWRPEDWDAHWAEASGNPGWNLPCVKREKSTVDGGTVSMFALAPDLLYASEPSCPVAIPTWFLAHVRFDDTVVTVNAPNPEGYFPDDVPYTLEPYSSFAELMTIVDGIRPRE